MENNEIMLQILSELKEIKANQDETNQRLTSIEGDVSVLKDDVSVLKDDVSVLKDDVTALKSDMAHHNHYIEPLLKTINEGVAGMIEKHQRLDVVEAKQEEHGDRIFALESAFKEKAI